MWGVYAKSGIEGRKPQSVHAWANERTIKWAKRLKEMGLKCMHEQMRGL